MKTSGAVGRAERRVDERYFSPDSRTVALDHCRNQGTQGFRAVRTLLRFVPIAIAS